jgi:nucleoside phosphorylase
MRAGILILSAHLPELSGLRSILGPDLSGTCGTRAVVARAAGIGLVAAARGAALALRSFEPSAAVFVGTCGAYAGRGVSIGEVVVGRRIFLRSTAEAEARGAFPAPMRTDLEASEPLSSALAGAARRVTVATTLAITTDDSLASKIADRGSDVEHLEAFAVADACAEANVPFAIVLGVANVVGSTARDEWRRHHQSAGHAAGSLVAQWLEGGSSELIA